MVSKFVIVPLSFAAPLSELVQSRGTAWRLLRRYWVTIELLLTTLATIVLLVHTQVIGHIATTAALPSLPLEPLSGMRVQPIVDAAAILILLVTTVVAVCKTTGPDSLRTAQTEAACAAVSQVTGKLIKCPSSGSSRSRRTGKRCRTRPWTPLPHWPENVA